MLNTEGLLVVLVFAFLLYMDMVTFYLWSQTPEPSWPCVRRSQTAMGNGVYTAVAGTSPSGLYKQWKAPDRARGLVQ